MPSRDSKYTMCHDLLRLADGRDPSDAVGEQPARLRLARRAAREGDGGVHIRVVPGAKTKSPSPGGEGLQKSLGGVRNRLSSSSRRKLLSPSPSAGAATDA